MHIVYQEDCNKGMKSYLSMVKVSKELQMTGAIFYSVHWSFMNIRGVNGLHVNINNKNT